MDNLTEAELKYVNGIKAEMQFFERYKQYMAQVKKIYIDKGEEAALTFIKATADSLLIIAADEMFTDLFNKL